jgi:hypothetical protein
VAQQVAPYPGGASSSPALPNHAVRRLERVQLHADLTILARLAVVLDMGPSGAVAA